MVQCTGAHGQSSLEVSATLGQNPRTRRNNRPRPMNSPMDTLEDCGPLNENGPTPSSSAKDEAGRLSVPVEEDCGGITNLGTLPIRGLSPDLECAPASRFPRDYRITRAGRMVDSCLLAWRATSAASAPDLLQARKVRIAADQNLARAERPAPAADSNGLVVRCHSRYMIRSRLSNLTLRQQRPDPGALCTDRALPPFLADPGYVLASTPKLLDQSLTS